MHSAPERRSTTSSVSSLVSLDNAVEAVAARVTPAVVNVSVTSRGHEEADEDGGTNSGQDPDGGMQNLPPEFRRFFGFGPQGRMQGTPQQQIEHGIGSGVILSPDGYILTNNHVVDGSMKINVTLNDRRVFPAKLVGVDKLNDLAVIKIDAHNLPTIAWGDSTATASRPDRARLRQPLRLLPVLGHARHRQRAQPAQPVH